MGDRTRDEMSCSNDNKSLQFGSSSHGVYRPRRRSRRENRHTRDVETNDHERRHQPSLLPPGLEPCSTPEHPISYSRQPFLMAECDLTELQKMAMIDCPICCEPMCYVAVGKCRDFVCWICATKLRKLQGYKACPFCKVELEAIVIMKNPFTIQDKKNYSARRHATINQSSSITKHLESAEDPNLTERFSHIDLDFNSYPQHLKDYSSGILYESKAIQQAVSSLFSFICWHPSCTQPNWRDGTGQRLQFRTKNEWLTHSEKAHKAVACSVCLEGRQVFLSEQLLFAPSDLQRHFTCGDKYTNPQIEPHYRCPVCSEKLFDLDCYYDHVKQNHVSCYICDRVAMEVDPPQASPAFDSFNELDIHYKQNHYCCPFCEYLAFRNDAELAVHIAQNHSGREPSVLSQATASRPQRLDFGAVLACGPYSAEERGRRETQAGRREGEERGRRGGGTSYKTRRERPERPMQQIQEAGNEESRLQEYPPPATSAQLQNGTQGRRQVYEERKGRRDRALRYWENPEKNKKFEDLRKLNDYLGAYYKVNSQDVSEENCLRNNTLLMCAVTQYLKHENEIQKFHQLSLTYSCGKITAMVYLSEMVTLLWDIQHHYNRYGYEDRRRAEPPNWRSWRQHFPDIHPFTDILFLLIITSTTPHPLCNALIKILADAPVEPIVFSEIRPSESSAGASRGDREHSKQRMEFWERRQQQGSRPPTTMQESSPTSDLHECSQHDLCNRGETLLRPDMLEISGKSLPAQVASLPSKFLIQKGQDDIFEDSCLTIQGTDGSKRVPDKLPSFSRHKHLTSPEITPSLPTTEKRNFSTPTPKPSSSCYESSKQGRSESISSLPVLANVKLSVSVEVPFLDALCNAVNSYIELDLSNRLPKSDVNVIRTFQLPSSVSLQLSEASRSNLGLLNTLMNDAKDYINQRSVEQILSLRAIYYLLSKQNSETTSRDWGCRCANVFQGLKHKELGFLRSHILMSISLLPQAALHEEFPELPRLTQETSSTIVTSRNTGVISTRTTENAVRATAALVRQTAATQPAMVKPKYGGRGGVQGKMNSSVFSSESHFPSLGDHGGKVAIKQLLEPLRLSPAEHWAHRITKQKITGSLKSHSNVPPSPFPSHDASVSSSSSSSVANVQNTMLPSSEDFPSMDFSSFSGGAVPSSTSQPKRAQFNNAVKNIVTSGHSVQSSQTSPNTRNHQNSCNNLSNRVVGGVGPIKCSSCGFGNPEGQKACQLCSVSLPSYRQSQPKSQPKSQPRSQKLSAEHFPVLL